MVLNFSDHLINKALFLGRFEKYLVEVHICFSGFGRFGMTVERSSEFDSKRVVRPA
jgi:hypothetical protein